MRRSKLAREVSFRFWRTFFGGATSRYMTEEGVWRMLVRNACKLNLRLTVRDPELRRRLTPDYPAGCKRIVMSTRFYPAIQRPNVEVVTEGIARVEPCGVVTTDGRLHEVDVLVLATGFKAQSFVLPIEVTGEDGVSLREVWGDVPKAYQTVALPGFPNLFMLGGPHNPLGNQPVVDSARIQTDYIMQWLEMYRRGEFDLAAPTDAATKAFNDRIEASYPNDTVWTSSDCNSYYIGKDGLPSVWPWRAERYGEMLRKPKLEDFALRRLPERSPL
jgi:cation diffusion facilitator CzcD-associated flavoprotein CzcO